MRWRTVAAALSLLALRCLATQSAYEEYLASIPGKAELARPEITFDGRQPYQCLPESPKRHKTCKVKSHDDMKTDDSPYIMEALHKCNDGGKVIFPAGKTYVVGTAMNLQFLRHVDIGKCISSCSRENNLL